MGEKYRELPDLNLEGQFLGFVADESGKYKHIRLAIPSGNIKVKIPKDLRCSLVSLEPGEQIRVSVTSKINQHKDKLKLKAYQVQSVGFCPLQKPFKTKQAKIMVCQKSGCIKKGGKSLLSQLEQTLCERGLLDKVQIEHTDCQKRCSSAPNCVLMLGKKEYKKVHPEAIASILENHLT